MIVAAAVVGAGTTSAEAHEQPGRLVNAEGLPKDLWLPETGRAYRVKYTSTGYDGRRVIVSGAVFVPPGRAPKGGWPVISWAHGTVGVADVCANSRAGRSQRDIDFLTTWLAAGYAIVASDYEGLGTPGEHAYLNGRSEAYGVIDIVRAARKLDHSLGRAWLSVGQSQGGQASLFTGSVIRKYAPELDYRGTIATAPSSQLRLTASVAKPFDAASPANPSVLMIVAGLRNTHPKTFDAARYLTPYGQELLAKAMNTDCYTAIAQQLAGKHGTDIFDVDAAEQEELLRMIDQDAEIPISRYREPLFIGQGTADLTAYPLATKITADKLREAGSKVTFTFYPGADHGGVMAAAKADMLTWAAARMR